MTEQAHDYEIPEPENPTGYAMDVATVFVVYQTTDGMCVGAPMVETVELRDDQGRPIRLRPARQASADDMWRGCSEVAKDISNAQVSAEIMRQMMTISRAAMEQQRNAQVVQQLQKNLIVPGR